MPCKDCLLNCDKIIPDKCIQYTGPEIPALDICPGMALSQVEAAIIEKLLSFADGSGIVLNELVTNGCSFMSDQLGSDEKSLINIIQILWSTGCTLKELIDEIETQIESNPVFNTLCLIGLPANPTRDDILQSAINLLCSINTTVNSFPSTYVKLSDLTNLVTQIVTNINGGGNTVIQNSTKMIPYAAMPYFGPMSNFDGTGKGVTSLGFDKIYICNGNNGTPDIRGRVVVASVRNVPGGTLDAAVDPVNLNNPNWATNDKAGSNVHTLTLPQIPSHTHTVTDPGHKHNILGIVGGDNDDMSNVERFAGGDKPNDQSGFHFTNSTACQPATTGITIASAGGGQPHNNIQPSIAAVYIIYIP